MVGWYNVKWVKRTRRKKTTTETVKKDRENNRKMWRRKEDGGGKEERAWVENLWQEEEASDQLLVMTLFDPIHLLSLYMSLCLFKLTKNRVTCVLQITVTNQANHHHHIIRHPSSFLSFFLVRVSRQPDELDFIHIHTCDVCFVTKQLPIHTRHTSTIYSKYSCSDFFLE